MVSGKSSGPNWVTQHPSVFDIVTGFFPETKPKAELRLRPCLVIKVLRKKDSGEIACLCSFGTSNLKTAQRSAIDLIIQNATDMAEMGLPMATRFDLDPRNQAVMYWSEKFFGCWQGYNHPKLGALTTTYQKEFAYSMMMRQAK